MTDLTPRAPQATVTLAAGDDPGALVIRLLPSPLPQAVVVIPSTLHRRDALAAAVRQGLRQQGVESHLLIPANPLAAVVGSGRFGTGDRWADVRIEPPDAPPYQVTLPARLAGAQAIWSVTDIDDVAGRGPFVLDLVARYLHPATRLRHLAARRREDLVADTNLAAVPAFAVIGATIGATRVIAVTADPIAAELVALALADERLPAHASVTGPWEERIVQRATELELGIQVPSQLTLAIDGEAEAGFLAAVTRIASRIGADLP